MADQVFMSDVLFPEYRPGEDIEAYVRQTNDYLFLLREGLMYALGNLGIANFNASQLKALTANIREPLNALIREGDEKVTALEVTAGEMSASLESLTETVTDSATGLVQQTTTLTANYNTLSSRVTTVNTAATNAATAAAAAQTTANAAAAAAGNALKLNSSSFQQTSEAFRFVVEGYTLSGGVYTANKSRLTLDKDGLNFSAYASGSGADVYGEDKYTTIDKDGLTVYKGKIRVLNNAGGVVFGANEYGELEITGTIYGTMIYTGTKEEVNSSGTDYAKLADGALQFFPASGGSALLSIVAWEDNPSESHIASSTILWLESTDAIYINAPNGVYVNNTFIG